MEGLATTLTYVLLWPGAISPSELAAIITSPLGLPDLDFNAALARAGPAMAKILWISSQSDLKQLAEAAMMQATVKENYDKVYNSKDQYEGCCAVSDDSNVPGWCGRNPN
jgi:hypothetical protein